MGPRSQKERENMTTLSDLNCVTCEFDNAGCYDIQGLAGQVLLEHVGRLCREAQLKEYVEKLRQSKDQPF
jgi:hypothetical protein